MLYGGTHRGVFKSADAGATWTWASNGVSAVKLHALVVDGEAATTRDLCGDDGRVAIGDRDFSVVL